MDSSAVEENFFKLLKLLQKCKDGFLLNPTVLLFCSALMGVLSINLRADVFLGGFAFFSPELTSIRPTKYSMLMVEEYISKGKDRFLVDPYPNLLYTKRKLAKQRAAAVSENITTSSAIASSSVVSSEQTLSFPDSRW